MNYVAVGEEGPRLIWDQDITATSSVVGGPIKLTARAEVEPNREGVKDTERLTVKINPYSFEMVRDGAVAEGMNFITERSHVYSDLIEARNNKPLYGEIIV